MSESMTRSGAVEVAGRTYYWERHGDFGRPVLVLLNGMASTTASWDKYLPLVADTYDVILYDYLGQGRSDAPDAPYSVAEFADALDAVLDVNDAGKAWLVGASYGGCVALEMLRLHAERVRGLFLSGVLLEHARLFEMYLDLSLRWYRELPFHIYPDYLYEKMFSERYVREHAEAVDAAKRHIAGFGGKVYRLVRLMEAQRDWLMQVDARRSEYAGTSVAAYVLAGAQDRLVPPWFQRNAASLLKAHFEEVPACGHPVYIEQTELFFSRLRTFAAI